METIAHEINDLTARLAVLIEQRNEAICAALDAGQSVRQVAASYDLTRQRVEQIAAHFKRIDAAKDGQG